MFSNIEGYATQKIETNEYHKYGHVGSELSGEP